MDETSISLLNRLQQTGDRETGDRLVCLQRRLQQLEDPASAMSRLWNRQHDRHVVRQLLALYENRFAPNTWKAFCRVAIEGERADVVATELGISLNAVFIAKSRVLSRLRQESQGLVDSSSDFSGKV